MDRYIGTKIVLAEPMDHATALRQNLARGVATIESDGASEPGYAVVYEDGYRSWSPKVTFERAYRRVTDAERVLIETGEALPDRRS